MGRRRARGRRNRAQLRLRPWDCRANRGSGAREWTRSGSWERQSFNSEPSTPAPKSLRFRSGRATGGILLKKRGLLLAALVVATFAATQLVATGAITRAGKFSYVERTISVAGKSQSKLLVAWCPRRTYVYGGGIQRLFHDGVVNASFPIDNKDRGKAPDDGWAVYYDNFETSRTSMALRAVCGPIKPRYRQAGFVPGAGRYV